MLLNQNQFVANVPFGQFLGVQGMMQSELPSVGFGSRVPEVYHIARCASDTFKVSKTFKKVAMREAICIHIGQALCHAEC